jgi:hypothetical protein
MKKIFILISLLWVFTPGFSGNFTPGNLVVLRVGSGSATPSSAATAVFLDEYTPGGTLVQSIALPTTANGNNHVLTLSGTAGSEGALVLSANGQYLSFAGYDAGPGVAKVSSDSTTNRTIGYVGTNGVVNTATGFTVGSAYVKNNIRGAVTNDGTSFWSSGTGSGSTGGLWYLPAGSFTSSAVQISTTETNTRVNNIFGGQLYTSSGAGSFHGVNSDGTGLPVTSGQTMVNLPGMPGADTSSSSYGFWLFDENPNVPGYDVMYICDDHTVSPNGGLYKYSLAGGTWVSNGNIPGPVGLRGITAQQGCSGVQLYLTDVTSIYGLTDNSGYNGTLTGTPAVIVSASTNTIFHGLAFAPGTISPTALAAAVTPTNVTCGGGSNGSVSTSVSGGTTPYTYNWSNSATTQNLSNVQTGTYSVTVNDAGGCSASASATISQPLPIAATPTSTAVTCYGAATGAISLTVSGGSGSYTYSWTNGSTSQNLSAVNAGPYSVTVTDGHNCTSTATASITQPVAISIVPTVTNLPCTGGANTGAVNIVVTGGTGADTYLWSSGATTESLTGLNAGTFTVTVTDASHCTATLTSFVSQSGSVNLTAAVTNVTCFGLSNGSISVTVTGGTPSYNYTWAGGTGSSVSSLAAGSYTVTVTDQGGCTLINSISVSQPAALVASLSGPVNESCYGQANGAISLSVSGGTNPYHFAWSNTSTSQNLGNLTAGTYGVTVTDSNACSATASGVISQPDSIAITGTVTNVTTFGGNNGAVSLSVTGGTPAYVYVWNTGSGADNTDLIAGQYCVTVTDAQGCPANDCFTVSQPTGINQISLNNSFTVYSNGDYLVLNADLESAEYCTVQVRDITGKMVYTAEPGLTTLLQMQIATSRLSQGCYIVTLVANDGIASKKVVITR